MTRTARTSTPLPLPELAGLLGVLGDESRVAIVRLLLDGQQRTAGQIAEQVSLPLSTCSYHLSKLLGAGITVCRTQGTQRFPLLRADELDARYPGLLGLIARGDAPAARNARADRDVETEAGA